MKLGNESTARCRVLVLGAGAIGGYFGGRLAECGTEVTFLVRPARREQIARDGLRVSSELGDISMPVRTVVAEDLGCDYDVVLLTCKAYDLDSAMDAIAPAVAGSCVIIPMLNGMSHLARLDARFGHAHVMGGTCMVDALLKKDGTIQHRRTLQRLVFGIRDSSQQAIADRFAAELAASTLQGEQSPDIMQWMWDKVAFLSVLAATTALFRANIQEIVAAPGGLAAIERTLGANLEIAAREGYPLSETAVAFARARLTDPTGPWSASLARDLESGGKIESDHIVGWMLDRAREHGVDDTMLSIAYTALKAYEIRRDAGRLG